MDESKDKELEEVNVTDSLVAVKTVVSSTTIETEIKEVVSSSEVEEILECVGVSEKVVVEEDGRACEVGDVMVEVLGSEVLVDGVMGVSGEVGSHELGRQHTDIGVVNVDGAMGGSGEVGSHELGHQHTDVGVVNVDSVMGGRGEMGSHELGHQHTDTGVVNVDGFMGGRGEMGSHELGHQHTDTGVVNVDGVMGGRGEMGSHELGHQYTDTGVVNVDGVMGGSGEVGSHELGHQHTDVGVVNVDGVMGGRGEVGSHELGHQHIDVGVVNVDGVMGGRGEMGSHELGHQHTDTGVVNVDGVMGGRGEMGSHELGHQHTDTGVVNVDGVMGGRGEMGSHELGHQHTDTGVVNVDGVMGGRGEMGSHEFGHQHTDTGVVNVDGVMGRRGEMGSHELGHQHIDTGVVNVDGVMGGKGEMGSHELGHQHTDTGVVNVDGVMGGKGEMGSHELGRQYTDVGVVNVDGVIGGSEEMSSHELGRQHTDIGVVNVDGDSGREVDESLDCQDEKIVTQEDDSHPSGERNMADQLENQSVGCDSNLAYSGSQDSKSCDIGKEKTVEVAVKEDIARKLGDSGGLENVELCGNESSHTVEGQCSDIDNSVLVDEKMVLNGEECLETVKTEDKGVNEASVVLDIRPTEQESQYEGEEHVVSEAAAHGYGSVIENEMVNGGISSVEASMTGDKRTCQEKADILDSVSLDSENANSKLFDLHTQTNEIELMADANKSILVSEPDKQINGKIIEEKLPFVREEESNDVAMIASVGHGALDESKLDGTYMDIDAASESIIHSENQQVNMHERGEDDKNNVIVASFSEVPREETTSVGMDIDAKSENKSFVCEADNDLKSNSEHQDSGAVILAKCNSGNAVLDDNIKSFDPVASANMDKQYVGAEGKTKNIIENLSTASPVLDAEIPRISVDGSLPTDFLSDSRQDGKSGSEGNADHSPKPGEPNVIGGVIQGSECGSGASCLDNHVSDGVAEFGSNTNDLVDVQEVMHNEQVSVDHALANEGDASHGVAEIGSNIRDLLEVQEAMVNEKVSVDHALSNEGDNAKLPKPVTLDADGTSQAVSNAKVDPEVLDKQAILLSASTDENRTIKLSDPVIASLDEEDGSNMEAAQKVEEVVTDQAVSERKSAVNEETVTLSDYVSSAADVFTQNNSIVEDMHAEGVVNNSNATPVEETIIQHNSVLSATVDTLGEACLVDENFIMGPFFVATEGPGESVARSVCVHVESGPTCDENGRTDAHVAHELPHLPFDSPVNGLEQEAADHDDKVGSDMEDAEEDQEAADHNNKVGSVMEDAEEGQEAADHDDKVGSDMEDAEEDQEAADRDAKADSDMEDVQDDQEAASSDEQFEEQYVDEEHASGSAEPRNKVEKNFSAYPKGSSLSKDHRISYQLPLETHRGFSVADLVWGKVKSHPWWPGQIFHPSDSSEKAMKYFRKDCYLVAYFGDRTFAWNEASVLKPFRNHFSVAERQNRTEAFQNAVSCALAEVSRRTELGLACSCVSQEAFDEIRYQMVENTGIREGSSKRDGVDRCTGLNYFQPDKLVQYVRSLAVFPTGGVDRLELVIAKAQLLAFLRLKGVDSLADFRYYEGISGEVERENAATATDSKTSLKGSKRKHNLKDVVYQRRKEKSMTELIGETMYYLDSEFDSHEEDDNMWTSPTGVKRKTSGFGDFTSQQSTKTISVAKVSHTASSNPQQSFKVGECIRRVASQLTGSPSILKGSSDDGHSEHLADGGDEVLEAPSGSPVEMSPSPSEQSSLDEMLAQLHLCAQDPMKGYSFFGNIVSFFVEFRNLAVVTQRQRLRKKPGGKRKSSATAAGTPETFEFEDRNDSYWKDMVVQNSAEAKPARRGRKRKDEQGPSLDSEKPSQSKPRKSSRKQYFHGGLQSAVEPPLGDEKLQNQLPAELMLSFTDMGSIPSEMNLNKMFKCFGSLKESETEIDTQSRRARVVYKKRADAEVAYSSAAMFNIFGSTPVNYQLNYTPSVSFRTTPIALTNSQEKAT